MAKGGKFTKLMKKLSFGKSTRSSDSIAASNSLRSDTSVSSATSSVDENHHNKASLHVVYVGKSRRRYLLTSDVVSNPLFQQLAGKSAGGEEITVGCEVVLFEHLLWMLENADPQPESLDELVEFYV